MRVRKPEKVIAKAISDLSRVPGHLDRLALAPVISAAAEELEHHLVNEARAAGATWTQIGHAFGMSKQAAQQRFRPKAKSR
jgi:hypothetical protein